MKLLLVAMVSVVVGCGGKDECKKLFDKVPQADQTIGQQYCADHFADLQKDPMSACILAASDAPAVTACIANKPSSNTALAMLRLQLKQADAEKMAKEAAALADAANARIQVLDRDLADLSTRMNAAMDALANAQNDADRQAARAKLEQLRKEKTEFEQTVADAKAAAATAERRKGIGDYPNTKCLDNPLAPGCS